MSCSFLLLLLLQSGPQVSNPVIATFQAGPVEIRGSGFGAPGPGSELQLQSGSKGRVLASTDPAVESWEDERIVLRLDATSPSGALWVRTAQGSSRRVEVAVYAYDWFDIPPTPGTNAVPLTLDVDAKHRVWVIQEFHLDFQMLDPALGLVTALPIPKPPPPGPFATTIFGDHRTQMSSLGEDVLVDPLGRVWFTQGGGYLYSGAYPNHSRVVCVLPDEPGGPEFRVYNVPGDWNEIIGLAWDPHRNWIWFANGGLVSGARLAGFDPEKIPWDNHFAFNTSLMHQVCRPGTPTDPCYHVYDLPNPTAQPAHLYVDAAGKIWYTAYWGKAIGRLDPDTGAVDEYPLPKHISKAQPAFVAGPGPWEILADPNGDVVFNEFFDATICRFDASRAGDPLCKQLDAQGRNPCIEDRIIPLYDPVEEQVHSIAYDLEGNLWFTIHTADQPGLGGSLGYLTPDWQHRTRLPPLSTFPGAAAGMADGIAVDRASGDIWFCEFFRKRVGRLRKVPELP